MVRQLVNPTQLALSGVVKPANTVPTVDGIKVPNGGTVFIEVDNSDAASHTVTVEIPYTVGGFTIQPKVVTVPASATDYKIGPFTPLYFDQPSGSADAGDIFFDFDVPADFAVRVYVL